MHKSNQSTFPFADGAMNQFKPIYQGTIDPLPGFAALNCAANFQKCRRQACNALRYILVGLAIE